MVPVWPGRIAPLSMSVFERPPVCIAVSHSVAATCT
jgi:hypothetical protein